MEFDVGRSRVRITFLDDFAVIEAEVFPLSAEELQEQGEVVEWLENDPSQKNTYRVKTEVVIGSLALIFAVVAIVI